MSDIIARQRQLIGTTAEWAAHDIVLADGEIGLERDTAGNVTAKIGDGTKSWSLLSYSFAGSGGGGTGGITQPQADARYIKLTDKADPTADGTANANKLPALDANGILPAKYVPSGSGGGTSGITQGEADARYVQLAEVAIAGGTAAANKIPQLDSAGVLPPNFLPDLSQTYVTQTEIQQYAMLADLAGIPFRVVRTNTPDNKSIASVVIPTADVTLPATGGAAGQMREGDVFMILNTTSVPLNALAPNLVLAGDAAVLASVSIAPAGLATFIWANGKIYVTGQGVS